MINPSTTVGVRVRSQARINSESQAFRSASTVHSPERIVPALLVEMLGDPQVRILDVRRHINGLPSPYGDGHVPGATTLDVITVLHGVRRRPRSMLEFAATMARLGVGDEHLVVVYDEGQSGNAATLAGTLVEFGHRTVGVLAGGWQRWVAERHPVERLARRYPPASFTATVGAPS